MLLQLRAPKVVEFGHHVFGFNTASGRCCCNVRKNLEAKVDMSKKGFNTASGRCCCNLVVLPRVWGAYRYVSIPRAVGVVATAGLTEPVFMGLKNRFWKTSYRKRSKRGPI